MKEDLLKLLEAQEIDLEIDKLMKSKDEYPRQISTLQQEITDLKTSLDEIEVKTSENQKNRKLIEKEIVAEREILSKKEKRLLETTTNKEYTAVQHEIESARERIDHLETEDLELMTELDTLIPHEKELSESYETTKTANTKTIEEIQKKYDSIESDISTREFKREKTLQNVNKRGLNVYRRLRKGKSGIAVATVDKKKLSCMGCFKQLPPQKVLETRRHNKLIFCENCGRILVWDPRSNDE